MKYIAIQVGLVLLTSNFFCFAQESVSAGGKWIRTSAVDKTTGKTSVSFILAADTMDPDRHPDISISCSEPSKPPEVIYNADILLGATRRDPMNYYAWAMNTAVKVDDQKIYRPVWDIVQAAPQKRAIVDRKTIHNLLTGTTLRVRLSDRNDESHLDQFTIGGLNLNELRDTCGSKWFGKEEASTPKRIDESKR